MKLTDYTSTKETVPVITFAAGRLGIPEDVELVINHNERVLDRFGGERLHIDAILHQMALPGKYQLIIRRFPTDPIVRILLHETVHLSQYVSGDLSLDLDRNIYTWKGQTYGPEIEYRKRPWEIEAFKIADQLWKEWKAAQKEEKKKSR